MHYWHGVGVYGVRTCLALTVNPRLTFHEASVNFLDGTKIEQQRILLAVYPLLSVSFTVTSLLLTLTPFQIILFHPGMDDSDSMMLAFLNWYGEVTKTKKAQ